MSNTDMLIQALIWIGEILAITVPVALSVAYITYAERRVIGWIQLRKGCNRVGPAGLLQPLADGLKLILKETIIPGTPTSFSLWLRPSCRWCPP